MKKLQRRHFFQALIAGPAVAPALLGQQPAANPEAASKIEVTVADAGATGVPKFFSPDQAAALRKASDLLMPAMNGSAGALDAGAPEFLDFLIGASDAARQHVYRSGLDGLNAQAKKSFNRNFGDLDAAQAATLMAGLHQPWTFEGPADPVARFLQTAKLDVRNATLNSREYSAGKRFSGSGLYWYPLD
jgi:hypothetical protein